MDVSVLSLLILTLGLPSGHHAGWTSLGQSHEIGARDQHELQDKLKVSRSDSHSGWTSLLESSNTPDADGGGLSDRVKEAESDSDSREAEGKQFGFGFGGLGLPSFLPNRPGYYNLGQLNKIPSSQQITQDVFNLPHGIPDLADLNPNNYHTLLKPNLPPFLSHNKPTTPSTTSTSPSTTSAPVTTTTTRRIPTRRTRPPRVPHLLQHNDDFSHNFVSDDTPSLGGLSPFTDIELPQSDDDERFEKPFPGLVQNSIESQLEVPKDVTGRLKSLEEIFSSLHIKSDGCRKRFVCHLAKDPEKFSPLSHLVLDLLDLETAEVSRDQRADTASYLDTLQAVEAGRHRMCYKYSSICQYKGEDMINSDGLRAWKLMYKVLTMKALAVKSGKIF